MPLALVKAARLCYNRSSLPKPLAVVKAAAAFEKRGPPARPRGFKKSSPLLTPLAVVKAARSHLPKPLATAKAARRC